jgi:hypothetical protein
MKHIEFLRHAEMGVTAQSGAAANVDSNTFLNWHTFSVMVDQCHQFKLGHTKRVDIKI